MTKHITFMIFAALPACTTMQAHDAKPYAVRFELRENYQAVYARTVQTMRRCLNPGSGYLFSPVTEQMDAQLYPDLGYGEIARYQANMVAILWSTTHIAKHEAATVVSIKTSSQTPSSQQTSTAWLGYWTKGGTDCPTFNELPPFS